MIKNSDIKALRTYFKSLQDIAFAFLFGSKANGKATSYLEKKITE
jgi:hypothetical protein